MTDLWKCRRMAGLWLLAGLVLMPAAVRAGEAAAAEESWQVLYLGGQRIGWARIFSEPATHDGKAVIRAGNETRLTFKRFGQTLRIETLLTTLESGDGDLLSFTMEMRNPPASSTRAVGRIDGDKLHLESTVNGRTETKTVAWDRTIKSPNYQERLLAEKRLRPGDSHSFKVYLPELQKVTDISIKAEDYQTVSLLDGTSRKLLKTTITQSVLTGMPMTEYLDEAGESVKTEANLLGMPLTTYTVPKDEIAREIAGEELDVAVDTLVKVAEIPDVHQRKRIVYRVTTPGVDPTKTLPTGPTQAVRKIDDDTAELTVTALPIPEASTGDPSAVPREFRQPTRFLQSDDPQVVEHARKGAGDETDPGRIARRLERYVHETLTEKNFSTAMASAAEVAERLEGDCTEHAVLLAALLRAKGIPSRVAVGVVYVSRLMAFGGHMWTEAYLDGRWIPLDATLGRGGIGVGHIKLADSSFADDAPTPVTMFLPLMNVLGNLHIAVVEEKSPAPEE